MDIFPKATTGMGFSGRCLFIFERGPRHRKAFPRLHTEYEQELVMRLREMGKFKGEIPLAPLAHEFYEEWYMKCAPLVAEDTESSFMARAHVHLLHLGLIMTMAKGEQEITKLTLIEALRHLKKVEGNLGNTMAKVGMQGALKDVETLVGMLKKLGGKASRSKLLRMNRLSAQALSVALDQLKQEGRLTTDIRASSLGKPTHIYQLIQEKEERLEEISRLI
jgi:hypothetical protein